MFVRSPSLSLVWPRFTVDRSRGFIDRLSEASSLGPTGHLRSCPSMADTPAVSPGPTIVTDKGGGSGSNPDYIAFVLVPVFFLLGLLGVVICHVLKRKGYRCTTEAQDGEEAECVEENERDLELGGDINDTFSDNNDTVGQIVRYIMKNEANSDALKAMVHENSIDSDGPPLTPTSPGTPTPPMTPVSPGAPPGAAKHTCNHLHTIGGLGGQKNICTRCSQKKWPLMRRPSARKAEQRRSHHGEVTVLAVGRFRVTKIEKPTRERRTLLISDSNGSVPTSPVEAEPKSRTTSESQQEQTEDSDKEKR
ncbi:RELT-like protein 1 isoform X2 [Cheilinus undulatus]|uniref:RELT-like protein 1 isoform X2 n=1 Tax=Cheilinus undulatus TaxID=241271 RepID=UPI001BD40F93|nr:RELT-like protein 1 isoform X2 [Cheilinus undulatus]